MPIGSSCDILKSDMRSMVGQEMCARRYVAI